MSRRGRLRVSAAVLSFGVEFDEDDDEIYILYKRIIREVFFKMCEDMKVC